MSRDDLRERKLNIFRKIFFKFLRLIKSQRRFIQIYKSKNHKKFAVLYYKFIYREHFYKHPNSQNVNGIINELNKLGYDVLLVDRHCEKIPKEFLKSNVDVFIGIDGYGSGKNYFQLLGQVKANKNIIIMTVSPPTLIRKRLEKRKIHREKNLNLFYDYIRQIPLIEEESFNENIKKVDLVLHPESADNEYLESIAKISNSAQILNWTTFEELSFLERFKKNNPEFVCMSGGDALRKGVDYAIHMFSDLPYKLHILSAEKDLVESILKNYGNPKNIIYYGFVDIFSKEFNYLCKSSNFLINFSATEGAVATAQLNLMKTGLVPIVDEESGLIDCDSGLIISLYKHNFVFNRKKIQTYVEKLSWQEYNKQSKLASKYVSEKYNLVNYRKVINKVFR